MCRQISAHTVTTLSGFIFLTMTIFGALRHRELQKRAHEQQFQDETRFRNSMPALISYMRSLRNWENFN